MVHQYGIVFANQFFLVETQQAFDTLIDETEVANQ